MATAAEIIQQNAQARAFVMARGIECLQQITSQSVVPSNQNVLNIPIQNVGLVRGFLVVVSGTIHNGDGGASVANRTQWGAANVLSQIQFTDLNNYVRINTAGWHLSMINSAKQALVFGGAYAPNVPINYGNNFTVQSAPATIADGADGAVQMVYYVPLAYARNDLRGAMWAGVVNATAQLQLTINPNPVVDATDPTLAVYSGAGGSGWKAATNVNVTVYQDYIDQVPMSGGQPILPQLDMSNIYELKNTALSGLVQSQDFNVPYANFRRFLSTCVIYDNNGTLAAGTDINYFMLQAANTTQIFKYPPNVAALRARSTFFADPPLGSYYFDYRAAPIDTSNYGNMNLVVNPSNVAGAGSSLLVGFEDFATIQQISGAAALPTGA